MVDRVESYLPPSLLDGSWLHFNSWHVSFTYAKISADVYFDIATSTDVKHVFSQGRILLSHIRNRLSSQSIHALMCLGGWNRLGLVKDKDIFAVTTLWKLRVMKKPLTRVGMPFSIFGLLSDTLFILPCSRWPIVSLQSCGRFYSWTVLKTYFRATHGCTCTPKAGTGYWRVRVRVQQKTPGGYPCRSLITSCPKVFWCFLADKNCGRSCVMACWLTSCISISLAGVMTVSIVLSSVTRRSCLSAPHYYRKR